MKSYCSNMKSYCSKMNSYCSEFIHLTSPPLLSPKGWPYWYYISWLCTEAIFKIILYDYKVMGPWGPWAHGAHGPMGLDRSWIDPGSILETTLKRSGSMRGTKWCWYHQKRPSGCRDSAILLKRLFKDPGSIHDRSRPMGPCAPYGPHMGLHSSST